MFKSILKPENSAIAGIAVVGLVYAIYQLNIGSMATAQATTANHPVLESSRKKAGYSALVSVAGLTLITRDANVGILGGAAIITMEILSRHSIMAHPETGKMQNPNDLISNVYAPAENVVPLYAQGQAG